MYGMVHYYWTFQHCTLHIILAKSVIVLPSCFKHLASLVLRHLPCKKKRVFCRTGAWVRGYILLQSSLRENGENLSGKAGEQTQCSWLEQPTELWLLTPLALISQYIYCTSGIDGIYRVAAKCATEEFSTICAVYIGDCEGWWLSGDCSSVVEHWCLKPGTLGSIPGNWWLFHFGLFFPDSSSLLLSSA